VAYEGDPDFALDGSNGNVFVEVPLVYYKRPQVAAGLEACGFYGRDMITTPAAETPRDIVVAQRR